jgi:hypothetical protein
MENERNISLEMFLNIKKERKVKLILNPGIPTSVPTKEDSLQKKPKKKKCLVHFFKVNKEPTHTITLRKHLFLIK